MEKKEKKADLEQLLNTLIEKGWKPFGIKSDEFYIYISKFFQIVISYYRLDLYGDKERDEKRYSYRELVSKESGLWQFCCNKGLVEMYEGWYWQNIFPLDSKEYDYTDYQYWLLESVLKDESELESFLLGNINVE